MHVAGSIHADSMTPRSPWISERDDLNSLNPKLWSKTVKREPDGVVSVGGVRITDLVERYSTPLYICDEADFRARARQFRQAFATWRVFYASKAFLTRDVAQWVQAEGLGLDVCSGNELLVAYSGGFNPDNIAFHGNNKSDEEIDLALRLKVGRIVVDSMDEIDRLQAACERHRQRVSVLLRLTTGVEAHTHEYIATAHEDQKFGFSIGQAQAMKAVQRCLESPWITLAGIHSHIGSQIFDTSGFKVAAQRTIAFLDQVRAHFGCELDELDLGGGFGIAYTESDGPLATADIAAQLTEIVADECQRVSIPIPHLAIEPGRAIAGPSTMAVYSVGTVKDVYVDVDRVRKYVSVDGGMSDNIRPALYAADYTARVIGRNVTSLPRLCRIVGKHCEGGDILVRDVFLPSDIAIGDLIGVPASGAYSRAMASNYNYITRPPVVSVLDGKAKVLLRRETLADLLALDEGESVRDLKGIGNE